MKAVEPKNHNANQHQEETNRNKGAARVGHRARPPLGSGQQGGRFAKKF